MGDQRTLTERLKEAQVKVKSLSASRDQIIRDAGIEEQKLTQAYDNLRQLGIENPEKYSVKELEALSTQLSNTLAEKLLEIEKQLADGEALVTKYNQLQET